MSLRIILPISDNLVAVAITEALIVQQGHDNHTSRGSRRHGCRAGGWEVIEKVDN